MEETVEFWNGSAMHGALLVLSNFALWPSIWLLARFGHWASALVLLGTFTASVLYHSCRAWRVCFMLYSMHLTADYLFVYTGIIWILTSLGLERRSTRDVELHHFAYFLFVIPTYFVVLSGVKGGWLPLVGIGAPAGAMLAFAHATKRRVFYNRPWTIVTFILIGVGGVFMFALGETSYWWAHPLWHVFSMISPFTFTLAVLHNSIENIRDDVPLWFLPLFPRQTTTSKTPAAPRPPPPALDATSLLDFK